MGEEKLYLCQIVVSTNFMWTSNKITVPYNFPLGRGSSMKTCLIVV